jgi:predicted RNA-binding Zn ribbon-like protein
VIGPSQDGNLALDLANTGAGDADDLGSPGRFGAWLGEEEPWIGPSPAETTLRSADFRELREAIRALLTAMVAGGPPPPAAVDAVNAASAATPVAPALDATDPARPVVTQVAATGSPTARILGAIARSAIELVGGMDRARLQRCAAPRCGAFFLARPRRVWCSDACGNRVRVARHRRALRPT